MKKSTKVNEKELHLLVSILSQKKVFWAMVKAMVTLFAFIAMGISAREGEWIAFCLAVAIASFTIYKNS